jgi:ketosteroid isomerase-like protein
MSQANVEVIRRGWDAWMRRDLPGLFGNFDPEVVWDTSHFHDWPEAAYHGIEGLERFLGEWLAVWADLEVEIDDVIAAPDGRVVTLFRQRGKGRDSGIPMEMSQAHIATLRNGKVTRVDNYEDRGEALRDAGLAS